MRALPHQSSAGEKPRNSSVDKQAKSGRQDERGKKRRWGGEVGERRTHHKSRDGTRGTRRGNKTGHEKEAREGGQGARVEGIERRDNRGTFNGSKRKKRERMWRRRDKQREGEIRGK